MAGARVALIVTLATSLAACGSDAGGPAEPEPNDLVQAALTAGLRPMSRPLYPTENPYSADRARLGLLLFFDPILSGPRDVACSTCHLPRFAFGDGRIVPAGAGATGLGPQRTDPGPPPLRLMPRNSPTVLNVGMHGHDGPEPEVRGVMFWGGGAFGLESQTLIPIAADNELRGLTYPKAVAIDSVLARLRGIPEYVDLFARAFPAIAAVFGTDPDRLVTSVTLARALASYLRELVTPDAPLDRFLKGDGSALDDPQKAGLRLFIGRAGCAACHHGPQLSDFRFHVVGVRQSGIGRDTTPGDDIGRGETGGQPYAFRTAPLRQVALTAPYFHDGVAADLAEVLAFKNRGLSENPRVPQAALSPLMRPLGLSDSDMQHLIRFLDALTDSTTVRLQLFQAPAAVPSGLPVPK